MSGATHTPGNWLHQRDGVPEGVEQYSVYEEKTGRTLATVHAEANALLIAAAPTANDLLREFRSCLRDGVTVGIQPGSRMHQKIEQYFAEVEG